MAFAKIKKFASENERHMASGALLLGFIVDNFTLTRIDLWFDNIILFTYLTIAGIGILFVHVYDSGRLRWKIEDSLMRWVPLFIQYAFGGLYSGFFIFYSRSASLSESWLFLVLLAGLLIGNESFKSKYLRFGFQIAVYYTALFSFLIFYIPILVGSMGAWVFLLSGVVSLLAIGAFLWLVYKIVPWRVVSGAKYLVVIIGGIYLTINAMYFSNVIPPIPLALKDAGVYHSVERLQGGGYNVVGEKHHWWDVSRFVSPKIHITPGEPVYFYSAVFSPTRIDTEIVHRWEYYDTNTETWVTSFTIQYPIFGGRDGGFRGYSIKESVFAGDWRVSVETKRKQILGIQKFTVKVDDEPVALETIRK